MQLRDYLESLGINSGQIVQELSGDYFFTAGNFKFYVKPGIIPTIDNILDLYIVLGHENISYLSDTPKSLGPTILGAITKNNPLTVVEFRKKFDLEKIMLTEV